MKQKKEFISLITTVMTHGFPIRFNTSKPQVCARTKCVEWLDKYWKSYSVCHKVPSQRYSSSLNSWADAAGRRPTLNTKNIKRLRFGRGYRY